MNRIFYTFYLIVFFYAPLAAQPTALSLKDSIKELEAILQSANRDERSRLLVTLAKTYYQDQNHERAFTVFLEAIEEANVQEGNVLLEDNKLYIEALSIYLDPHAQSTRDTASTLLEKYTKTVQQHPEYTQLAFLVAASYANAGQFSNFFDLFYQAYLDAPHHYLAFKTIAILHIKLLERAGTIEKKDFQRKKIAEALLKAMEIYPQDHTLYKMTMAFSPKEQKTEVVKSGLKKIIDNNIVIPRTDIGFYIEEAVKSQQFESAQQLLDKAREWYQYSRIINTAQEFLDQQRKRA